MWRKWLLAVAIAIAAIVFFVTPANEQPVAPRQTDTTVLNEHAAPAVQPKPRRIVDRADAPSEEPRGPRLIVLDADAPADPTAHPDEQSIDVGGFLDVDIDFQSDEPGEAAVDVGDFIDADV